jgi:excinuclease ABC subunit A
VTIEMWGVRTHNLRGIDVTVPHGAIVAVTGVSGSGKSSLVLDTLHAEAQLRYVEGFDPYVRSFLTPRDRPQVDRIRGLTATLAVDQRNANRNPRSTLGTLTGVDAFIGLVFARLARADASLHPAQFDPWTRDGICPSCLGARELVAADPASIVPDPDRPVLDAPWFGLSGEAAFLPSLAAHHRTDLDRPWRDQPAAFREAVLHGTGEIEVAVEGARLSYRTRRALSGAVTEVERAYANAATDDARRLYHPFLTRRPCPTCDGTGLGEIARTVTLRARTFRDVTESRVDRVREWLDEVDGDLGPAQRAVGRVLVPDLRDRLDLLIRLGLGHLELNRSAPTLSGGELQRARLSARVSTALTGLTYVFDEPGAGLHPADKHHLLALLRELRDAGNSVLLVEHDPDVVAHADWVIDLGPGGGRHGGRLVATGPPATVAAEPGSVTGRYLREPGYRFRRSVREPAADWLVLRDVTAHNVAADEVRVPLNRLTCVTGVSGSGKSSLLSLVAGCGGMPWVEVVDQAPIGRTPRSNPATYTKVFDRVRRLFAATGAGLTPSLFSFNSPGGRCEPCQGLGRVKLDLHFLGDTYLTCHTCDGRRYTDEVLAVTYRGLAIDEVLALTVAEAMTVFDEPVLAALDGVGLGYLTLGQSGTALSGGEAQRIRLARATARGGTGGGPGLLILDEPVTGLHPDDAQRLMSTLDLLLDRGHTVVIAEHDLHAAASADWIIDLGPGAGPAGGRIINTGPPARVAAGTGPTAPFLRRLLA